MWVVLRYTEVLMELASSLVKRMSKKGSFPSDSFSAANWMLLLMLLRWLQKDSTRSPGRTVQVLAMYILSPEMWSMES